MTKTQQKQMLHVICQHIFVCMSNGHDCSYADIKSALSEYYSPLDLWYAITWSNVSKFRHIGENNEEIFVSDWKNLPEEKQRLRLHLSAVKFV